MALCTKTEVKSYLDLKAADTSKDNIIDDLILAAQDFIEEYCNRLFEQAAITEYHKGGSNKIFLKQYPIATTPAVIVWDSWDRAYESGDIIATSDYFVDADNGIIQFDYEIGGFFGAVKVSYTGGYASGLIPSAIGQACIELVARKVKEGPSGGLGVPTRSIPEGGSVTFVIDALLPQTKVALDRYVRPPSD